MGKAINMVGGGGKRGFPDNVITTRLPEALEGATIAVDLGGGVGLYAGVAFTGLYIMRSNGTVQQIYTSGNWDTFTELDDCWIITSSKNNLILTCLKGSWATTLTYTSNYPCDIVSQVPGGLIFSSTKATDSTSGSRFLLYDASTHAVTVLYTGNYCKADGAKATDTGAIIYTYRSAFFFDAVAKTLTLFTGSSWSTRYMGEYENQILLFEATGAATHRIWFIDKTTGNRVSYPYTTNYYVSTFIGEFGGLYFFSGNSYSQYCFDPRDRTFVGNWSFHSPMGFVGETLIMGYDNTPRYVFDFTTKSLGAATGIPTSMKYPEFMGNKMYVFTPSTASTNPGIWSWTPEGGLVQEVASGYYYELRLRAGDYTICTGKDVFTVITDGGDVTVSPLTYLPRTENDIKTLRVTMETDNGAFLDYGGSSTRIVTVYFDRKQKAFASVYHMMLAMGQGAPTVYGGVAMRSRG